MNVYDNSETPQNNMKQKKVNKKHVITYELNPSSQILFEDALKNCIGRKIGQNWNKERLKYAPANKHSPFGDFPPDFMPKKSRELNQMNKETHKETSINERHLKIKNNMTKSTAFSSLKKNNTDKVPKSGAFQSRPIPVSTFRLYYDRGDLPILVEHTSKPDKYSPSSRIKWKENTFKDFNYQIFLPIFVEGIREKTDPYRFLAIQGTFDLLTRVNDVVVKVIPQLILPLKAALNTRDPEIVEIGLKVIQQLVLSSDLAGEALVPYYRQLLPIFNIYINRNANLGDRYEYNQRKKKNLGDLIQETLEIMESRGGDVSKLTIYY